MSKLATMRRLPLRDLLNQMEHRCRELQEHLKMDLVPAAENMQELSRPKRKKSAYPTMRQLSNGYETFAHALKYAQRLTVGLDEGLKSIEERAHEITG